MKNLTCQILIGKGAPQRPLVVTGPVPLVAENGPKQTSVCQPFTRGTERGNISEQFYFLIKSDDINMKVIGLMNVLVTKFTIAYLDADPCPDGWRRKCS